MEHMVRNVQHHKEAMNPGKEGSGQDSGTPTQEGTVTEIMKISSASEPEAPGGQDHSEETVSTGMQTEPMQFTELYREVLESFKHQSDYQKGVSTSCPLSHPTPCFS